MDRMDGWTDGWNGMEWVDRWKPFPFRMKINFFFGCQSPRIEDWRFSEKLLQSRSGLIEDWRFSKRLLQSRPGLKKFFWESSIFKFFWESSIFNLQSRPGLKKFFWESSISNLQSDTFCNLMQLIANSRYFKGNQKWQEKRCQKNIGEKTKNTLNTSRNVKTVFFWGGLPDR